MNEKPDSWYTLDLLRPSCSLFLLSALLVQLGAYLSLHDADGRLTTVSLGSVYGTQLAYQAALVLAITFLYRVRRSVEETVVLLAALAVFLLDGTLIQHLYGWERGPGLLVSALGCLSAVGFLAAAAWAIELPLLNRAFASLLAAVCFARFGPALLAADPGVLSARYLLLGWILLAVPLTALLPPLRGAEPRLPLQTIERGALLLAVGLAALHFALAGRGLALALAPAYLAPLVVVLGPFLERVAPGALEIRALRWSARVSPAVGLMLAAASLPQGLFEWGWARAWPLTPWYLTLLLVTLVEADRVRRTGREGPAPIAALLAMAACLGGDLPEMLASSFYPRPWQVLLVLAVAWRAIARNPGAARAALLHGAASFVVAGGLREAGYPWIAGFALALAWGVIGFELLTRRAGLAGERVVVVALAGLLPVLLMLADSRAGFRIAAAAASVVLLLGFAGLRRDRLYATVGAGAGIVGLVGYPLARHASSGASPGQLVTEIGFLLLLIGVLHAAYGSRLGWLQGELGLASAAAEERS